jgi:hypothetical protein
MGGSHPARALAQALRLTLASPLLPKPLVREKRFTKGVQQRKLGPKVLSEGCCPTHYFPPNGTIIYGGENAPGGLAYPAINNECRHSKSSNQALESTAPATVQSLASEHYKLCTKARGRLGEAIDWRADSHLYR